MYGIIFFPHLYNPLFFSPFLIYFRSFSSLDPSDFYRNQSQISISFRSLSSLDPSDSDRNQTQISISSRSLSSLDPSDFYRNQTRISISFRSLSSLDPSDSDRNQTRISISLDLFNILFVNFLQISCTYLSLRQLSSNKLYQSSSTFFK